MAQRASLRDHTSLTVEKARSNRTVYILRSGVRAAYGRVIAQSVAVRDYRSLEIGRRRANLLVLSVAG